MSKIKRHRVRKIVEKKEKTKPFFSKQAIWTIVLGGLMILSVFGIVFSGYDSGSETVRYGGYKFKQTAQGWKTDINENTAQFKYLPQDLTNIKIDQSSIDTIRSAKAVYITFDPNTKNVAEFELARFELAVRLNNNFQKIAVPAIISENDKYNQLLIDCENATAAQPVIKIVEANNTQIITDGSCVIIESDRYSASAISDALIYSMLDLIGEKSYGKDN